MSEMEAMVRLTTSPDFRLRFGFKLLRAAEEALNTPDVEVKISFDSSVEFLAGTEFVLKFLDRRKDDIIFNACSGNKKQFTIEFKNGSALTFINTKIK
jgi:hypothetical protein